MSGDSGKQRYIIDIEYTDAGFQMVFDMENWYEKIEEDFTTFEAIKDFYRKDTAEFRNELSEAAREVPPGEPIEEPTIVVKNAPKEWKEDSSEAAPYLDFTHRILVQLGLQVLIQDELDEEEALLEQGQFKPLIVRQSAFFEELLILRSLLELQSLKEETLSSKELNIIEQMGHQDRLRFAHLLGIIDEDEHGLLQEMAKWRNRIAHTAWPEFDAQDESQIQSTAERVNSLLNEELKTSQAKTEEAEPTPEIHDSFIGFPALSTDLQNVQLGILAILREQGGEAKLAKVQEILTEDDDLIAQRSLRMDDIGYLRMEGGKLEKTPKGEELLDEYWDQY